MLSHVTEVCEAHGADAALDVLFREVDALLRAGLFSSCESILKEAYTYPLEQDLLTALLTITFAARGHLPSWDGLANKADFKYTHVKDEHATDSSSKLPVGAALDG